MSQYVKARHGVVCSVEQGPENFFGWPSVAKLEDGTIVTASSGLRWDHICPFGKEVLHYSRDNGETYEAPQVLHDDMIDNRDAGVTALGGEKFGVTWFSLDIRSYDLRKWMEPEKAESSIAYMNTWDEDTVDALSGSWTKLTSDGGKTWTRPIRLPVSAPHGYMVMKDGRLGYLGKGFRETMKGPNGDLQFAVSGDGGYSWKVLGSVPLPKGEKLENYHEPHVVELQDGSLLGAIRYHAKRETAAFGDKNWHGYSLDTCLSFSHDGGYTWTEPRRMHIGGSPPHLLRHSSGAIVLTYGYREPGFGQRAVVSYDEGQTWSEELIIRDDADTDDVGYPCSIELDDGTIYTVYYQALHGQVQTSVLWSKWELPER